MKPIRTWKIETLQVTCSPRPPTLSQRHMDLREWSHPDVVIYSKFNQNPFRVFEPQGSKFAHSHYFGYWLLQQLARRDQLHWQWHTHTHTPQTTVHCNFISICIEWQCRKINEMQNVTASKMSQYHIAHWHCTALRSSALVVPGRVTVKFEYNTHDFYQK